MRFVIVRLSDKKSSPHPQARLVGKTLFEDPVYGIEVTSLEELMALATRSPTSAPGDIGITVWRRAPQGMSLTPELDGYSAIEIYDDVRDSY